MTHSSIPPARRQLDAVQQAAELPVDERLALVSATSESGLTMKL